MQIEGLFTILHSYVVIWPTSTFLWK